MNRLFSDLACVSKFSQIQFIPPPLMSIIKLQILLELSQFIFISLDSLEEMISIIHWIEILLKVSTFLVLRAGMNGSERKNMKFGNIFGGKRCSHSDEKKTYDADQCWITTVPLNFVEKDICLKIFEITGVFLAGKISLKKFSPTLE